MNILLTGSTGFIGSYFLEKYSEKFVINTFSFQRDNFKSLNLIGIETVVHLSALVHQINDASLEQYEKINVMQTINLAKKAKRDGVRHFVFMSTVKVYGEEASLPYNENSLCAPQDDYGKSKYKAEQELKILEDEKFIVSIIRTPIVYGKGVKANIKNLINLVQKVSILPLQNIYNKRSIVYIGNLCYLMAEVITQKQSGIFLASDDKPLNTTGLIELIAKNLNKKIFLVKIPFFETMLRLIKPSFHKRLYGSLEVNNTLTKEKLHFKNPYTTEEGFNNMIQGEVQCH